MSQYSQNNPLIEYWVSNGGCIQLPPDQQDAKRKWKSIVMVMNSYNQVVEYEVNTKSKVRFSGMLDIVIQVMREIDTPDTKDCGFKLW